MGRNARTTKPAAAAAAPATDQATPAAAAAPATPAAPATDQATPAAPPAYVPTAPAAGFDQPDSIDTRSVDAYRAADTSGKAKLRATVDALSKDAVRAAAAGKLDPMTAIMHAGYWQRTLDAMKSTPAAPKKATVDPRVIVANRVATLRLAADMLAAGIITPDSLDMGDASIVAEWSDGRLVSTDIPTGTPDLAAAERIAASKITRAANRHDIGAAIAAAFDGMDVGTELTVSQIITRAAAAGFDATPDWNGRVTARLIGGKNGSTVPGVAHARIGTDRTHGGRKVA